MCRNKCLVLISAIVLVGIAVELLLRYAWGFCDALLYQSSEVYEYIAQPNQTRRRFGANICYNSYSQRNGEPDSSKVKILGFGDSVLFGGTWMDQDSLATTLFSQEAGVQMLNISCGSWGPDNCAAYLEKHGDFDAQAIVLVCSSHDAYDVMSFTDVVGAVPNYPEKQYSLAWGELIGRYLWPRISSYFNRAMEKLDPDAEVVVAVNEDSVARKSVIFNPGFDKLKNMADSLQIPMSIYLHAELGELDRGEYNDMGKSIICWAARNDVPLLQGLMSGEKAYMYKDVIHFNEKGQRHLADAMKRLVRNLD